MTASDLIGSWELVSFELEDPQGQRKPWGRGAHGLLLYTSDGHMSVAVNREVERSGEGEFRDLYNATLFYSGTYQIEGDVVIHRVLNASEPARIGKDQPRGARLSNEGLTLELSSPPESWGRGIVVWRRAAPR